MLYLIILKIIHKKMLTNFVKNKLFHIRILLGSDFSMASSNAMKQFCITFQKQILIKAGKKREGLLGCNFQAKNKCKFKGFGM